MRFIQHKDGSCDIEFSWKERLVLFKKGKLHLSDETLRHFGNNLMKMVMDWQFYLREDVKKLDTHVDTKVEGK